MGKSRLLLVEDDADIGKMLSMYFTGQGFDVDLVTRGAEALERTRQGLPHLIVLDIVLPDIDGYEVCRQLRTSTRTSHIPVIFLTQKDERGARLQGLELGADDYITKPFDIEELKLRVQGAIRRAEREALTDPRSGLPTGRLIEEQLRQYIRQAGWAYLDVHINTMDKFNEVYGFVAGDDVVRFIAMLLTEVVDECGTPNDFIGHAGGASFVILTTEEKAQGISQRLKERIAGEILSHYNFRDRDQGCILVPVPGGEEKAPLMSLSVGVITPERQQFSDIRELTEMAAERRRQDVPGTRVKG